MNIENVPFPQVALLFNKTELEALFKGIPEDVGPVPHITYLDMNYQGIEGSASVHFPMIGEIVFPTLTRYSHLFALVTSTEGPVHGSRTIACYELVDRNDPVLRQFCEERLDPYLHRLLVERATRLVESTASPAS